MSSFESFSLSGKMVGALKDLGYVAPTPIQEEVLPKALKGKSLVAQSETGSGKTHSFLIPIIERTDLTIKAVQAIIISPTRELARQTYSFARGFLKAYPDLRICLVTSGEDRNKVQEKLRNVPHIIIATPGRLKDLALSNPVINMMSASTVVLDEADMLMEMGFFNDINQIISSMNHPSIMVFSATITQNVARIIEKYIEADHVIALNRDTMTSVNVNHYLIDIRHRKMEDCIVEFIEIKKPYLLLVFASKKETVAEIYMHLRTLGYKAGMIHGDLEARERKSMMKRIRLDEFPIVVCSDMAARGIDIPDVTEILNVDLPKDISFYYHRAGRTGRAEKKGDCYTFYHTDTLDSVRRLLSTGLVPNYLVLKDGELKEGKPIDAKKIFKNKKNGEIDAKVRKAIALNKSDKVKPGYKKKVKQAVDDVKRQHRRETIRKDIRRQQVERIKKAARKPGGNADE